MYRKLGLPYHKAKKPQSLDSQEMKKQLWKEQERDQGEISLKGRRMRYLK